MTNVGSLDASREAARPERRGWKELYLKEDWWAVWLGFALMVFAILLFQAGSSNIVKALAINPGDSNGRRSVSSPIILRRTHSSISTNFYSGSSCSARRPRSWA